MSNEINFAHAGIKMADLDLMLQGWPKDHPVIQRKLTEIEAMDAPRPWKDILRKDLGQMIAQELVWQSFQPHETLAHIVQRAGLFPSVGQARKNGWDRPIPPGFSQFTVGKKKLLVTIINQF